MTISRRKISLTAREAFVRLRNYGNAMKPNLHIPAV
jgi:hypothetical protein